MWKNITIALFAIFATAVTVPSFGKTQYPGQYAQYNDQERTWFKTTRSPNGVPCCNIADGHLTTWRAVPESGENSTYEVPLTDAAGNLQWTPVPKAAIVRDAGNPFNDAVVWFVEQGSYTESSGETHHHYFVRCFVAPGGA